MYAAEIWSTDSAWLREVIMRKVCLGFWGAATGRSGSGNRLCIPWNERVEAACRARIAASGHLKPANR